MHVFKKHFEYCCGSCQGNNLQEKVSDWLRLWMECSSWVERKWNEGWMESYILDKNSMVHNYSWEVIHSLVFFDADAEFDVRDNSAKRIKKYLLQFLTLIYDDCEYFVYNQRTFGNESFHSVCNRYYEKGSVISFPIFQMKRQFAALDWNEQMRKKANGEDDNEIQDWQIELRKRLIAALNS